MHFTREDGRRVRWWNVAGLALFGAFLVFDILRPDGMDLRSPLLWTVVVAGLAAVALMPRGVRLRRGRRSD